MEKRTNVFYNFPELNEYGNIPVLYSIQWESENIITVHCKIDLNKDEIPKWLNPVEFKVRQVHSSGNPGVTITQYSHIKCKTKETAYFIGNVFEKIRMTEKNLF